MTDKELLEDAAKAAGIEIMPMQIDNVTEKGDNRFIGFLTKAEQWPRGWFDPLTDDGDALRLAVQLKILVDIGVDSSEATNGDYICHGICELHRNSDHYAATRRAIVRAAAEIGKTK